MKKFILLSMTLTLLTFTAQAQFGDITDRNEVGEEVIENTADAGFRTQTIGGWGSRPRGNNPGAFLHDNWDQITQSSISQGGTVGSITIGVGGRTLTFLEPQAITDFLPSGGQSGALPDGEMVIDPGMSRKELRNYKNTLASQVLALSISVGVGANLSEYKNLAIQKIVEMHPETGEEMSVGKALEIGNNILGGVEVPGFTADSINEIITQINESFVDGIDQETGYISVEGK